MAKGGKELTIKIWDVWIENGVLYGIFEIMQINKLIYLERKINDNSTI